MRFLLLLEVWFVDIIILNFENLVNSPKLLARLPVSELRKHWKNVRDRYVKVRNQREQHFSSGGGENSAPKYCFYESLYFLKDFCITTTVQKDQGSGLKNVISSKDIEPDPLLFLTIEAEAEDEEKMISGDYIDYTEKLFERWSQGSRVPGEKQFFQKLYRIVQTKSFVKSIFSNWFAFTSRSL